MRTRFPPSPTGFLHIGGLRTALFSYLLAKKKGGTFYVRIEDTDQSREVAGATLNILQTLHWAGIYPDEGVMLDDACHGERRRTMTPVSPFVGVYLEPFDGTQDRLRRGAQGDTKIIEKGPHGPYFQSKRLAIYREHVERLLASGAAYRCFCTTGRLDAMRKEQEARHQAPMYDRTCLRIPKEEGEERGKHEKHVVRMKISDDGSTGLTTGKEIVCKDRIRGEVRFSLATLDDQVLLKSDGFPTYHLAHVVDDHLMETSLVVRGEEWLPSLPKHLLLFRAFGWEPPEYAHVPLLLAKGGGKLSKRQGDVAVEAFRDKGYLPEAILNFIALLGWNPGTSRPSGSGAGQRPGTSRASHDGTGQRPEKEQEIFSLPELIERFDLSRVQKAGAIFDTQKLDWLQGQWMRRFSPEEFAKRIQPLVAEKFTEAKDDRDFLKKAKLIQERITFFSEAPDMLRFFYEEPSATSELLVNEKQGVKKEDLPKIFEVLLKTLEPVQPWEENTIAAQLSAAALEQGFKKGQLLWPLRSALTGLPYSPGAFEVAAVLGQEKTLARLKNAKELVDTE